MLGSVVDDTSGSAVVGLDIGVWRLWMAEFFEASAERACSFFSIVK